MKFSYDAYESALIDKQDIFLYFCSDQDPICLVEKPDIIDAFDMFAQEGTYPNLTGFVLDFQNDQVDADEKSVIDLFSVEKQHTKIIVVGGEEIVRATDAWTLRRFEEALENALSD